MPPRTHPIQITVLLASADYRVFASAARQLRRIMGRNAPDVPALIQFNLQDRDATGIADDYLDAIRWPNSAGRVVTLKRRATPSRAVVRSASRERSSAAASRTQPLRCPSLADPSRN